VQAGEAAHAALLLSELLTCAAGKVEIWFAWRAKLTEEAAQAGGVRLQTGGRWRMGVVRPSFSSLKDCDWAA